ncbi:protein PIN-LIKES 7-like [Andrographis paniculata]|uniref:protein PIN-LIKES 7-like n=1 Tax=Andrographis paniculata TaxID=175694 RepID=UPI0021E72263|nr:protein PIN-LIKES 7-like [Andrographis paniculata]
MGVLGLLEVSSMPILQVLIISALGALMATDYLKLLPPHARHSLNKIVFVVFSPSLVFSSLAKTVTIQEIISWWFMPVNIGMTFVVGGILGWIAAKLLRLEPYLQNLVMAMSASGNLGNIMLIIIPAICKEDGSPFGDKTVCKTVGLSYASFSMALGAFYIWTYTYYLMRSAGESYGKSSSGHSHSEEEPPLLACKEPNKDDLEGNVKTYLLKAGGEQHQHQPALGSSAPWKQTILGILKQLWKELRAPPILAAILGFIVGAVSWLRNLIIGSGAPLRVIDDSITLLGDGAIPSVTLILGGNLIQGMSKRRVKASTIIAVICVRYIMLPAAGIGIVKAASYLGFLPADPLYHFVLMIQFTLPPAMAIGTMAQLFDIAQEECSVMFLWTYLVAAFALTGWSTVFMWILS